MADETLDPNILAGDQVAVLENQAANGAMPPPPQEFGVVSNNVSASEAIPLGPVGDEPAHANGETAGVAPPPQEYGTVPAPVRESEAIPLGPIPEAEQAPEPAPTFTAPAEEVSPKAAPYDWASDEGFKLKPEPEASEPQPIPEVETPTHDQPPEPAKETKKPDENPQKILDDNPLEAVNREIERTKNKIAPLEEQIKVKEDQATLDSRWGTSNEQGKAELDKLRSSLKELQDGLKGLTEERDFYNSRDFTDQDGNIRRALTGETYKNRKKISEATPKESDEAYEDPYRDLEIGGENGLLQLWADAENRGDKTQALDIQDAILERISAENLTEKGVSERINVVQKEMELRRQKLAQAESQTNQQVTEPEHNVEPTPEPVEPQPDDDLDFDGDPMPAPDDAETTDHPEPEIIDPEVVDEGEHDELDPNLDFDGDPMPDDEFEIDEDLTRNYDTYGPEAEIKARSLLDDAIARYADAKIQSERILSGKPAEENLIDATQNLRDRFDDMMDLIPEAMRIVERSRDPEYLRYWIAEYGHFVEVGKNPDTYFPNDEERKKYIDDFQGLVDVLQTELDRGDVVDSDEYIALEVVQVRAKIEQAMIDQRVSKSPRLTKVMEFIKGHPKTRLAASVGFTALGFTPLAPVGVAGKAFLRGFGAYQVARSIGEMRASKIINEDENASLNEYLEASRRQSTTLRNSKRIGAAAAALAVLTPGIISIFDHHSTVQSAFGGGRNDVAAAAASHTSSASASNLSTAAVPMHALNIQPAGGNTLPWDYGMSTLHTNISNPNVLNQLVANHDGIKFIGNGLSGGQGSIQSVFIPGQGTFSDPGHINGAIQYILNSGATQT